MGSVVDISYAERSLGLPQQISRAGGRCRHRCSWRLLLAASMGCLPLTGWAQSLSYLRGDSYSTTQHESSLFYKIEYQARLFDGFAMPFDYVNEGHLSRHHPDGYGLELSAIRA